jgi:signal transduction histidine kinase
LSQLELVRKQQDFVSAVSHELKTPLTSIRMYGEMLLAGWADEDKKQGYYEFIYHESERLSRLIANVLQLARMTRNDPQFDLKPVAVAELVDLVRSKIASQLQRAGFELEIDSQGIPGEAAVLVDTDAFTQVFINLVDNAIKFSAGAEKKRIELRCSAQRDGAVLFTVRDYGPGIPAGQLKKIFTMFYRSENELTRETVGTGIGLALVHQLVGAMNGKVDVRNRDPGAEFRVSFPMILQR